MNASLKFFRRQAWLILFAIICLITLLSVTSLSVKGIQPSYEHPLWQVYQRSLLSAKYVDLTKKNR